MCDGEEKIFNNSAMVIVNDNIIIVEDTIDSLTNTKKTTGVIFKTSNISKYVTYK